MPKQYISDATRAHRAQAKNGQDSPTNSTNFAIYNACSGSIGSVFQTAGSQEIKSCGLVAEWRRGGD